MKRSDVLIIGAGPTGLVLALWLTRMGVTVRLIDKTAAPGTTSRALAVQARTLELYRQLDLTDSVLQRGHRVPGLNLWARGKRAARVPFATIAGNLSPYGPFVFPQDQHELLLIERLAAAGVTVERNTELLRFSAAPERVGATLRGPDGQEEACEALYLAGCDGARSGVRQGIGAQFPGGTYDQLFYVADVDATGPALDGELHVGLDEADFLAVFPLKGEGRARLIGTVRGDRAAHPQSLKFEDVSARAIEQMKVQIRTVNWFSTYHVHHRVADRFRQGRIFLLGDAAHIHSPAGGQGMNTGIGDAINLAWKLQSVLAGHAADSLLDTYQAERQAFARKLVATTDRGFTLATDEGRTAGFIRTRILPIVVPALFKLEAVRNFLYRAVSQLVIEYRASAISRGSAGRIHAGDRLPWAKTSHGDNFDTLTSPQWQLHVYGSVSAGLTAWCQTRVVVHAFEWEPAHARAGFAKDALYLVRPDGYVALAMREQDPLQIERYLAQHDLRLAL
ncbi:MAG TPA: FAD-dependent oxidoreductase [Steroidobacteraceae bacterium]|nr:FAD-dependent oxidoreductase [Steroidobacteraceae bacterium]